MTKIYQGWETIKALQEGKVLKQVSNSYCNLIKLEDGKLFYNFPHTSGWKDDAEDDYHYELVNLLELQWEEVKEVKENKNKNYLFDYPEKWEEALKTFIKLREHPLAKPNNHDTQFGFKLDERNYYNGKKLIINYGLAICPEDSGWTKGDSLTAWFDSEEDATSAKNDIGYENLIKMFLTLNGDW